MRKFIAHTLAVAVILGGVSGAYASEDGLSVGQLGGTKGDAVGGRLGTKAGDAAGGRLSAGTGAATPGETGTRGEGEWELFDVPQVRE